MIKISFRKNQIYLILLIISYLLRRILSIIISEIFKLDNCLLFCFLMCFGEIFGGLSVYSYQRAFLNKNKKSIYSLAYKFGKKKTELKRADNWLKIFLLIYFASFFDIIEFIIVATDLEKASVLSTTANLRLSCIVTITSSLLCAFTLRFKIGKHQIFSLVIMGICLSIIIVLEFVYMPNDINLVKYIISFILIFFHFIFMSFTDIIERYLYDYDFLNPLLILMTEGIFGFISTSLYSIYQNPFTEIKVVYNNLETGKFIILIILLILHLISSAVINVYKILCNVLYSPMTKSLDSYFLNSIFIIYHYIKENDFIIQGKRNFFYFFINLIFSVIIDFLGLIYNEFLILNFCKLADDTHAGIAFRADSTYIEMINEKIEEDDYIYEINQTDDDNTKNNLENSFNSDS